MIQDTCVSAGARVCVLFFLSSFSPLHTPTSSSSSPSFSFSSSSIYPDRCLHHRVVILSVSLPLFLCYLPPPFLLLSVYFFIRSFLPASLSLSLFASRTLLSSLFLQPSSSYLPRRISHTSMRVFRSKGCVRTRVLLSFERSARPFLSPPTTLLPGL